MNLPRSDLITISRVVFGEFEFFNHHQNRLDLVFKKRLDLVLYTLPDPMDEQKKW